MPDEIRTAKEERPVIVPPPEVFSQPVIRCPSCEHGIDPHGIEPGDRCMAGYAEGDPCECMWSPNDIAAVLISEAAEKERLRLRDRAASATVTVEDGGLATLRVDDPHGTYWTPVSTNLIRSLIDQRNEDTKRIQRDERARCVKLLEEARDRYIRTSEGVVNGNSSGAVVYNDAARLIRGGDE